jgi:hypothetical protein
MITQLVLTAGLLACLFYAVAMGRQSRWLKLGIVAVVFIGTLCVWNPELTNAVAHAVGIGRGADLLIYLWIVLSLFVALRLHLHLRSQQEHITILARALALRDADDVPRA